LTGLLSTRRSASGSHTSDYRRSSFFPPSPFDLLPAKRGFFLAFCWVLVLVVPGCLQSPEVSQPIAFSHGTHAAQEEIACTECHRGAEVADHATIPRSDVCADCHDEAMGESAEEARLVEWLASGNPIPWQKVTLVADHVHFSHRRHVVAGQILCETCHGEVKDLMEPITKPFIDFQGEIGMERCIACHRASGNPRATVDCVLCHK